MQQNEDGATVGGAGGHKHEVPEPVRKKACTKPTPAQTPTRPSHDSRTSLTCVPRRTCLLCLPAAILLRFRVPPDVVRLLHSAVRSGFGGTSGGGWLEPNTAPRQRVKRAQRTCKFAV